MFAMLAGAVAKRTMSADALPKLLASVPLVNQVDPKLLVPILSHPEIVAGVVAEVACEPQEAYDSVAKYIKAGVAGYAGGMIVERFVFGASLSY